jgi:hypothetical protein
MLAVYLDRHNWLDFSTAGSLQLQSTSKFVTPLGHIIMIPSQLLFGLTPLISEEAANIHYGSKIPAVTMTVFITILEQNR